MMLDIIGELLLGATQRRGSATRNRRFSGGGSGAPISGGVGIGGAEQRLSNGDEGGGGATTGTRHGTTLWTEARRRTPRAARILGSGGFLRPPGDAASRRELLVWVG